MAKNDTGFNNFFSSLIQDVKSYSGTDPLLPWLRGIKKMKDSLPSKTLKEKLPRFLQKCTETFESDRRYRNDMRYLRVWLQLMDFVDDPKALLRKMEMNKIGTQRSLFYQAYALYYEKMKKFEEAEKMYHLGVQNFAEPADELQKSYEQFVHRTERRKKKKIQQEERRTSRRPLSARSITSLSNETKENNDNYVGRVDGCSNRTRHDGSCNTGSMRKEHVDSISKQQVIPKIDSNESRMFVGDDTVVVKFVDTALVGRSEAEDACHHGLVDPTINLKEAIDDINNMFKQPLDTAPIGRRSHRSQRKEDHSLNNGFAVFVDDNLDNRIESSKNKEEKGVSLPLNGRAQIHQPHQEPFKIFVDGEESDETGDRNDEEENFEQTEVQTRGFVFPTPKDLPSESSDDLDADNSPRVKFREDTVVHRFVGSTISDEPNVENVCHHGLVEPTINLKEAMDDINNMFGKPIDFVRAKRPKKQDKEPVRNQDLGGFSILPDDDLEPQRQAPPKSSRKSSNIDLFEPTMFTKEAIDDINKMFGMPLDF